MFGFPTNLIIGGILFLVISGCIIGVIHSHDNKVRATQKAADQDAITAAQTNTATCKAANVSLQASVDVIEKDRVRQNDEVLKWQGFAKDAVEISDFWKGKFQATQAKRDAEQRDAHNKGRRPPDKTQTCQQVLDEINADDRVWLADREVRMRDILGLPANPDALKVGK